MINYAYFKVYITQCLSLTAFKTRDMKHLSFEQKQFYHDNGFVKLENIFTHEELTEISEEYDSLFKVN